MSSEYKPPKPLPAGKAAASLTRLGRKGSKLPASALCQWAGMCAIVTGVGMVFSSVGVAVIVAGSYLVLLSVLRGS